MHYNRETLIQTLLQERESSPHQDWMTMDINEYNYYLRTMSDDELIEQLIEDE